MSGMNANKDLYEQWLYYNSTESPYQCLALPWWVQTRYPTYYPRHFCHLEPLICGETVFRNISIDIKKAQQSVDIITWGFDPGMVLRRGETAQAGQRYGDLLIEVATRKQSPVLVRLLVWHDNNATEALMKNIPGYYGTRFPAVGCATCGFYDESHQNYNATWFEEICAGKYPNISFHVRDLPFELAPKCLVGEKVPDNKEAKATAKFPTHHQKMLLIDYELPDSAIGYVMGHNSITDFWDTAAHKFQDPKRESFFKVDPALQWKEGPQIDSTAGRYLGQYNVPDHVLEKKERARQAFLKKNTYVAKPYQDVSVRVQGPVLYDLNHNFCQAWEESTYPSSYFTDIYWLATKYLTPLLHRTSRNVQHVLQSDKDKDFVGRRKAFRPESYLLKNGRHSAQLMRTQPLHGEKTIKECYANMTRQMQHYIFIQNQYVQYEDWALHLKECIGELRQRGFEKPVYVFILTSTPERDGMDLPTYDVAKHIGQSPTMKVEHQKAQREAKSNNKKMPITAEKLAKAGINVVMASLWTCAAAPSKAEDYEEIYIHAKVAIVDDAAFTVGSANLNLRSMALDSELNLFSQAHEVAFELRQSLFLQCSGSPGPAKFADMRYQFVDWKKKMSNNVSNKEVLKPLIGQIVDFSIDRKPGAPIV